MSWPPTRREDGAIPRRVLRTGGTFSEPLRHRPARRARRLPPERRRTRTRPACAARGTSPDARRGNDAPRCLDEVAAMGLGRDLQPLALEAHAVVPAHRALVVLAQHIGQSRTDEGHEGRPRLGGRDRELLVERPPVVLGQIAVLVSMPRAASSLGSRSPAFARAGSDGSRTSARTDRAPPASRPESSPPRAGAWPARTASHAPGPPCPPPRACASSASPGRCTGSTPTRLTYRSAPFPPVAIHPGFIGVFCISWVVSFCGIVYLCTQESPN